MTVSTVKLLNNELWFTTNFIQNNHKWRVILHFWATWSKVGVQDLQCNGPITWFYLYNLCWCSGNIISTYTTATKTTSGVSQHSWVGSVWPSPYCCNSHNIKNVSESTVHNSTILRRPRFICENILSYSWLNVHTLNSLILFREQHTWLGLGGFGFKCTLSQC